MKLIKKHGGIVLIFALGWAARGILAGTDAPIWLSIFVSAALLLVAFGIMAGTNKKRPAPRASFDTELTVYLQREDRSIITNEQLAFQEFGSRGERSSPFLATCVHAWDDIRTQPHVIPVHECTLGVMTHGPKCVCRCGATAAYVEREDGSIDKTFEEPKGDGS